MTFTKKTPFNDSLMMVLLILSAFFHLSPFSFVIIMSAAFYGDGVIKMGLSIIFRAAMKKKLFALLVFFISNIVGNIS